MSLQIEFPRTDRPPVVVRGLGDVGSAVAWLLFREGWSVVLQDSPQPTALRRGMALADAAFDGSAVLEGVTGCRADDLERLDRLIGDRTAIPVVTWPVPDLLEAVAPAVLIDARMRKRTTPEIQRGLAPLTIGLGPNFTAGKTTDLVIETSWGPHLGDVIRRGSALPLSGEPRPIDGIGRERCVYAPGAGRFETDQAIGAIVRKGDALAAIGDTPLCAPLDGKIRGLVRAGVPVSEGTKVIEIDPRGAAAVVHGLGERPQRIAEAVLRVVELDDVYSEPRPAPRQARGEEKASC
ncbi:xanthine dehydrogenase [Virgifigura deserti]|uniref:xanthine dehydrogenase n=1 Tax=Virgifigura deserti TaxID=2268457 RepID=UPI003CCC428B